MAKNQMQVVNLEAFGCSDASAEIVRGKSIRLLGTRFGKVVDKTFNIGDMAEYDSYNLSYYGTIESITDKTVTIKPRFSGRKFRLKLNQFFWRNYDFDLETKAAENAVTSYYI